MDEQLNKKDFASFLPTMGCGRVGTWQEGSIWAPEEQLNPLAKYLFAILLQFLPLLLVLFHLDN
jgi:hypothetical protein